MGKMGEKIAQKRKDLGMTQTELAERLSVSRQTVSRWESSTVMPDIDKIADIAGLLGVSCDYLLKEEMSAEKTPSPSGVGRLLMGAIGKTIRIDFFDGEADKDLFHKECRIIGFEGNWVKVEAEDAKGRIEKLLSLSSILSIEIVSS